MFAGQKSDRDILLMGASALGLSLNPDEADRLLLYAALVKKWNQKINLVSHRDVANLISGHILDSLAGAPFLARLLEGKTNPKVMDLGSGGGLPGIPLKICLPEIDLTLLESTKKKARFLETAVKDLGLVGVSVVDRHSSELEKDPVHQGRYEVVTARAVAEIKKLIILTEPFLKPEGSLLAFKGKNVNQEISALKTKEEDIWSS